MKNFMDHRRPALGSLPWVYLCLHQQQSTPVDKNMVRTVERSESILTFVATERHEMTVIIPTAQHHNRLSVRSGVVGRQMHAREIVSSNILCSVFRAHDAHIISGRGFPKTTGMREELKLSVCKMNWLCSKNIRN